MWMYGETPAKRMSGYGLHPLYGHCVGYNMGMRRKSHLVHDEGGLTFHGLHGNGKKFFPTRQDVGDSFWSVADLGGRLEDSLPC